MLFRSTSVEVGKALKAGANINEKDEDGLTSLMCAAWYNMDPQVIRILVGAGASVKDKWSNEGAWTPLIIAAINSGDPEVFKALLRSGSSIKEKNIWGESVLMLAAAYNPNPLMVKTIIGAGASINEPAPSSVGGGTALMYAAGSSSNPQIVMVLLKSGANGKVKGNRGQTAYDNAIENPAMKDTEALVLLEAASK